MIQKSNDLWTEFVALHIVKYAMKWLQQREAHLLLVDGFPKSSAVMEIGLDDNGIT